RGDFGTSLRARRPVNELLRERFPNSLKLAGFAMALSLLVAFPLGVAAAARKGTLVDTAAKTVAALGQALPTFWVGIVLIEVVAGRLQWLPAGGTGGLAHYVLPGVTLGWFVLAGLMRLLRSSVLEVLDADYVRTARAKGAAEWTVIWRHALRNALIPVVTFAVLAGVASPADPYAQHLRSRLAPPIWSPDGSWQHPLGTDRLGRDLLSRLFYGARVSLAAGVVTVALAGAVGGVVGLVAGYLRGRTGALLIRRTY